MQITEIEAEFSRTCNLGNYSNVKPAFKLKAILSPDDDLEKAKQELFNQAQVLVEAKIDEVLEKDGEPAVFYEGPRVSAALLITERYIAIFPGDSEPLPRGWHEVGLRWHGHRFEGLKRILSREKPDYIVGDFSAGDFDDLPEVAACRYITLNNEWGRYLLVLPEKIGWADLPEDWQAQRGRYDNRTVTRFSFNLLHGAKQAAAKDGLTLIDCLDGDLSRIPPLAILPKSEEPDPFSLDESDDLDGEDPEEDYDDDDGVDLDGDDLDD